MSILIDKSTNLQSQTHEGGVNVGQLKRSVWMQIHFRMVQQVTQGFHGSKELELNLESRL